MSVIALLGFHHYAWLVWHDVFVVCERWKVRIDGCVTKMCSEDTALIWRGLSHEAQLLHSASCQDDVIASNQVRPSVSHCDHQSLRINSSTCNWTLYRLYIYLVAISTAVQEMWTLTHTLSPYYSAPVGGSGVLRSACLSVCVSVCPREYLWNRFTDLHEILFADSLWPWLGPPLAALQCVMYFRFYGWCNGPYGEMWRL